MITLHCPKTLNSKLFVLRIVYLCIAHLFTMVMKAENIDINSKKKMKIDYIVKKIFQHIRKGI